MTAASLRDFVFNYANKVLTSTNPDFFAGQQLNAEVKRLWPRTT